MCVTDKSITINSLSFVNPKFDEIIWLFDCLLFGCEKSLEDIGQMTNIEFIMEILGSLSEVSFNFLMKRQCSFDDWSNLLLNCSLEFTEMLVQVSHVNCGEGRLLWETNSKQPEMSLETWVNDERTSGWVHSCNQLGVLDILKGKLALIIPMLIISMLSEESNSILGVIWISGWHVHIINEVNKLVFTNWGESLTSFLFKLLFHHHLEKICISVEVEIDDLLQVLITSSYKLIQKTLDDLSFTATSETNQNWAVIDLDKLFHQE